VIAIDNLLNISLQTSKKAASVELQPSSQNPEGQCGGMGMGKFITALELKYACTKHDKKYCFTKPDGEHRHLTQADIAQWALMIISSLYQYGAHSYKSLKHSDFEMPPPGLKLFDPLPPCQGQQKKSAEAISEPAALQNPTVAAMPSAHHQVIPPAYDIHVQSIPSPDLLYGHSDVLARGAISYLWQRTGFWIEDVSTSTPRDFSRCQRSHFLFPTGELAPRSG
jgi:hypothetical protein